MQKIGFLAKAKPATVTVVGPFERPHNIDAVFANATIDNQGVPDHWPVFIDFLDDRRLPGQSLDNYDHGDDEREEARGLMALWVVTTGKTVKRGARCFVEIPQPAGSSTQWTIEEIRSYMQQELPDYTIECGRSHWQARLKISK